MFFYMTTSCKLIELKSVDIKYILKRCNLLILDKVKAEKIFDTEDLLVKYNWEVNCDRIQSVKEKTNNS